ncbi:polysaccharide biosynthesis/export family protein [Roseinatronobacter sp.]|uniref:polysaccharide biosynthesis/export family protein n=1 Tax=Roseinatronobacter sp. TaxID=1945755 RepID=UPI0025E49268|nr:polysaccharide biosynthesis/export family protein [Roseibaca sp.]
MTEISRRALMATGTAFLLTGCAVARDSARKSEIVAGADTGDGTSDADFALVDVTDDTLDKIAGWPVIDPRPTRHWPNRGGGITSQKIAPGDRLSVRVWTAEETSLITSLGERYADISDLVVSPSGHIVLPYVEEVHVAGLAPEVARVRVQERLSSVIPSAQVQLTSNTGMRNSVDMLDGVRQPGTFPLAERNLTVLNLVSAAGGVADSPGNPQIMITRGGTVYRMPYEEVLEAPELDVALHGGDRVVIRPDERSFTSLGATGGQRVFPFPSEDLSALRAVSVIGGIADNRADPRGLLVLRRYPAGTATRTDGPPRDKVVFSFDLTRAERLFAADQFLLQDGDVVLATMATGTTLQRALGLFGGALNVGRALRAD